MKDYIESLASTICLSVGFEGAAAKLDRVTLKSATVARENAEGAPPSIWPKAPPSIWPKTSN